VNMIAVLEVARRMRECSPEQQLLLNRFYVQGDSIHDIARHWKCSDVAVRIRLHRARQKLAAVA
jgi:DNA-directed RNA polymerase specialized sigma24 family protein